MALRHIPWYGIRMIKFLVRFQDREVAGEQGESTGKGYGVKESGSKYKPYSEP